MKNLVVSETQFEALQAIINGFNARIILAPGLKTETVRDLLWQNASLTEKAELVIGALRCNWAENADCTARARHFVLFHEKNLQLIQRVFSAEALLDSMKAQPFRSESTAKLFENAGGKKIATLVRQSL